MLVLNCVKIFKLTSFVKSRNYCISKFNVKRDFCIQDKIKYAITSNPSYDEIFNNCVKNGISPSEISNNDWIFHLSINHLSTGFKLLNSWKPKHMDDLFVLLQMSLQKLLYFTRKTIKESKIIPHGNRIYYFSENFKKEPQEVCYHVMRHTFLLTKSFPAIQDKFDILVENNVDKNDIWRDTWIFMYSFNQINQRISYLKEVNLPIKPWMLRCQRETFDRTIEIKRENRVVLNKDSTAQYLAKRLNVSENTIRYIGSKYPNILRVNPTKLKEILDFLLKQGYLPSHILRTPRVFTHSISTLEDRFTELRNLGCQPTLAVLCKNKTTYQELLDKLIAKDTKNLNNV